MKLIGILVALCVKTVCVENLMIPSIYQPEMVNIEESAKQKEDYDEENQYGNIDNPFAVIGLNGEQETNIGYDRRDRTFGLNKRININRNIKKPCLVVLVSNSQSNPSVQSLLRKYRYDANGILIPSSVKYYIKMHQEYGSAPILVPLTGKDFSPLGGFVRYYKEVPPIPPSM